MIGKLIMKCFHARTTAHVLHLKTRSYATHKALNEFYDEIVELTDSLAEAYQGAYGLIEDYDVAYKPVDDPMKLIDGLAEWIETNRFECCDESETTFQNIIDEILALCYSTAYKLRFLK